MVATILHKGKTIRVDFYNPIDISIPLDSDEKRTKAWYVQPVKIEPVKMGDWIGDVNQGAGVNFRNIFLILTEMEPIQNVLVILVRKIIALISP